MAAVNWNLSSYDTVRAAILALAAQGLGIDFDGFAGYQCWDLAANLYYNAGRETFKTENSFTGTGGTASYVQTAVLYPAALNYNSQNPFQFVQKWSDVKRGMMCVWRAGGCNGNVGITGHNAFADEDVTGSGNITCLGQNQTGSEIVPPGGHYPTLNSYFNSDGFIGAFAYKSWFSDLPPEPGNTPGGATLNRPANNIVVLKRALQIKGRKL